MILLLLLAQDWTDVAWEPNDGWSARDGRIERVAKAGTLWSKDAYGDFVLRLEFKMPPGGNSGILFRSKDNVEHQIELLGNSGGAVSTGCTGSIFRRHAPTSNPSRKPGEWNAMELEVRGRTVRLTFNDVVVHEAAVVDDLPFRGPVGLQEHGTPLWFRDVKIRRLDAGRPAWETSILPPLTVEETRVFIASLGDVPILAAEPDPSPGLVREAFEGLRRGDGFRFVPPGEDPEVLVLAGLALQALEKKPGLWDAVVGKDEVRVRVVPEGRPFTINARAEPQATPPIALGTASLQLLGHPAGLLAAGTATGESVELRMISGEAWTDVVLRRDRAATARNPSGEALRFSAHVERTEDGFAFEFFLPYVRGGWRGREHGRYTIAVGEARQAFRLSTTEADVKVALRRELGSGLAAWRARGVPEEHRSAVRQAAALWAVLGSFR